MSPLPRHRALRQRGAALLLAMLILSLVATAAAAMVWQQQRAVEQEAAERARAQAAQILAGALDWARLILRNDADKAFPPPTWVGRLDESRLSAFLAADASNSADATLEVFLSGEIRDAQGRYNLRRLFGPDGKPVAAELAGLRRLCAAAGAAADLADRLAEGLAAALVRAPDAAVLPAHAGQLTWLGIAPEQLARVLPYIAWLPKSTALNANSAEAPALLAAIEELSLADAVRVAQAVQRKPAENINQLRELLPAGLPSLDVARVDVKSRHFDISARLRYEDRVIEEQWLVERRSTERGPELVLLRRERRAAHAGG